MICNTSSPDSAVLLAEGMIVWKLATWSFGLMWDFFLLQCRIEKTITRLLQNLR